MEQKPRQPKEPCCFIYVCGTPLETEHDAVVVGPANFQFSIVFVCRCFFALQLYFHVPVVFCIWKFSLFNFHLAALC
jgi:hypothetical protein